MTRDESARLLSLMLGGFPSAATRIDSVALKAMQALWGALLESASYADGKAAVLRLCATRKFLPTISELLAEINAAHVGPRRSGLEAWGDVMRAVSRFGAYRDPEFTDPHVTATVRAMGWQEICASENQVADRARFVDAYEQISARGEIAATAALALGGRQSHGELAKARENPDSPGLVEGQRQLEGAP